MSDSCRGSLNNHGNPLWQSLAVTTPDPHRLGAGWLRSAQRRTVCFDGTEGPPGCRLPAGFFNGDGRLRLIFGNNYYGGKNRPQLVGKYS